MNNNLVSLEYSFLFDPTETWQHLSQFEQDLAKFFDAKGLEARIIKTVGGEPGRRIIYITKKIDLGIPEEKEIGRPKTLKGRLREMQDRKLRVPSQQAQKGKGTWKKLTSIDRLRKRAR